MFKSEIELYQKSNYENDVSLDIELNKTCFSIGEYIHGIIILTPKKNSNIKEFLDPYAIISLKEKQNYESVDSLDDSDEDIKPIDKNINEIRTLIETKMDFSDYLNKKMIPNLKIQFKIKVPKNSYPSCFFETNTFVIHYLTIQFDSLKAKKSKIIIIKNSPYFSKENNLLKIPAIYKYSLTKHKYAIFDCGYLEVQIILEKNICPYNENLPIIINIDCKKLYMIELKSVKLYIYRCYKKNQKSNKKYIYVKNVEEMVRKTIPLREGEKMHHIEDGIKLPISSNDLNPEEVYKLLDKDKREPELKFNNIKLYPSCEGGLLSCQYYIKIILETDTLFSTNITLKIPIDFYSPYVPYEKKNSSNINKEINNNEREENEERHEDETKNDLEDNLNINNQQVYHNEFNSDKERNDYEINDKNNKNNIRDERYNDNSEGFEILPDEE